MHIDKAKSLKVGDAVRCPGDRGEPEYVGRVAHISFAVAENSKGEPYVWVTVTRPNAYQSNSVWPSNRLN